MNRGFTWVVGLLALALVFAGAARLGPVTPVHDVRRAAAAFLGGLSPELLAKARLTFDVPERTDWHFVPRRRPGVTLGEMNDAQRMAARGLLRSAMSAAGMLKVETIMSLDAVLREMERAAGGDGASRDPGAYAFAVFGDPDGPAAWGWRVEGHHVSLNFTVSPDGLVAVTPAFLGANPAEVRKGPRAGQRALGAEEDIARELLLMLDEGQRTEAVISADAPGDILTMPGRDLSVADSTGLAAHRMTEAQRAVLGRLLDEYAGNFRRELAEEQRARLLSGGIGAIRFAWAGGTGRGEGHYYRLTGPDFIIEYDNTQNGANHVHTVWHDRKRDFGRDLLKEHYDVFPRGAGHTHGD